MEEFLNKRLRVSQEVRQAVTGNRPVVALESTIISHGMPYPQNVETARNVERIIREEVAAAFMAKEELGLKGGMLVANPIPEEYSMDADFINRGIDEAIADCVKLGIHGKAAAPYLLKRVNELTAGKSLGANIQLVYNNTRVAARIAKALCAEKK